MGKMVLLLSKMNGNRNECRKKNKHIWLTNRIKCVREIYINEYETKQNKKNQFQGKRHDTIERTGEGESKER